MSERNTGSKNMKKQILFNPDNSGADICRTIKHSYNGCRANLIRTSTFGQTGVLEIETMQKLINPESNENARIITGVMEEVEPKIVGYTRDSKCKVVKRSLRDTSNTVTTFTGSGHNTDMYMAEPKINLVWQYDSSQNSRVIGTDGVSYCMANGHKDGMPNIIQPNVLRMERTQEGKQVRKQNGDKGMKFNQGNKEYKPRTDGVSNTLSTSVKDNMLAVPELRMEEGCLVDKEGHRYRIRKLTPTECFRLMDVEDKDIEKIKSAGIAKTNLYKLAGNSIVVSCMFHLFRKLFIEKDNENQQLELF